jgi:hypothetical protein
MAFCEAYGLPFHRHTQIFPILSKGDAIEYFDLFTVEEYQPKREKTVAFPVLEYRPKREEGESLLIVKEYEPKRAEVRVVFPIFFAIGLAVIYFLKPKESG